MNRFFSTIALCAIAICLSGCFGSPHELWPIRGGEDISVPSGKYACVQYGSEGERTEFALDIERLKDGDIFFYRINGLYQYPMIASFYKMENGLYVVSSHIDAENISGPDNIYYLHYARVSKNRVVTLHQTDAQARSNADWLDVELKFDNLLEEGTIEERRELVLEIGQNMKDARVDMDCAFSAS